MLPSTSPTTMNCSTVEPPWFLLDGPVTRHAVMRRGWSRSRVVVVLGGTLARSPSLRIPSSITFVARNGGRTVKRWIDAPTPSLIVK